MHRINPLLFNCFYGLIILLDINCIASHLSNLFLIIRKHKIFIGSYLMNIITFLVRNIKIVLNRCVI